MHAGRPFAVATTPTLHHTHRCLNVSMITSTTLLTPTPSCYNCCHLDPAMSVPGTHKPPLLSHLRYVPSLVSPFTSTPCRTPHHCPATLPPPPQLLHDPR